MVGTAVYCGTERLFAAPISDLVGEEAILQKAIE